MEGRDLWKKYLTVQEKQIIDTEDPKSRIVREIIKNCWSREHQQRSDNRFERYINRGSIGENVKGMREHLTNTLKGALDLNGDTNKRKPGDYIKSDDWRAYAKEEELDIIEMLGINHPEAVAIRFKCKSRLTYTRAKLAKLEKNNNSL